MIIHRTGLFFRGLIIAIIHHYFILVGFRSLKYLAHSITHDLKIKFIFSITFNWNYRIGNRIANSWIRPQTK